jgi:hypothetical protein
MNIIRAVAGDSVVEVPSEDTIRIGSHNAQELLVKLIEALARNSVQIESVSVSPPTLEEVFLTVVNGRT